MTEEKKSRKEYTIKVGPGVMELLERQKQFFKEEFGKDIEISYYLAGERLYTTLKKEGYIK